MQHGLQRSWRQSTNSICPAQSNMVYFHLFDVPGLKEPGPVEWRPPHGTRRTKRHQMYIRINLYGYLSHQLFRHRFPVLEWLRFSLFDLFGFRIFDFPFLLKKWLRNSVSDFRSDCSRFFCTFLILNRTEELDAQCLIIRCHLPFLVLDGLPDYRLLSQPHLVTDSYPWETLLTLKLGRSTTVTTSDCGVKFLVLPFTVKIANRRNRDISGKIQNDHLLIRILSSNASLMKPQCLRFFFQGSKFLYNQLSGFACQI